MRAPKISVIIPCYNMEEFLPECLDSVLSQTLSEIEAICVNDGSTDRTLEILQQYQQRDSRVIIIDQENQGVAAARNTAIRKATGEFVVFMDPDDFYPEVGTLELLYTKASDNHALICGGSFSYYNNRNHIVSTNHTGIFAKYTLTQEGFIDYRDYQFDFGYHRFLYNRQFLLENDIFFPPYKRFQDPPFFVRAMITAGSFYAIPDVVYRYRCGFQAAPTSWPAAKLNDMLRGHRDNLILSAQHHLSELHALTVTRFEENYVAVPVLQELRAGNKETLMLLIEINHAICPALLKEAGVQLNAGDHYILREFDQILSTLSGGYEEKLASTTALLKETKLRNKEVTQRLRKELVAIKGSASYRIGRMITYIPRKIRGGIRCCREHGFGYTFKHFLKKIHK